MDDERALPPPLRLATSSANKRHWLGRLDLRFDRRDARSYLGFRQHTGPLVMQKTLHPEGTEVCHGVLVHPPGGVAGGDHLQLNVEVAADAKALITTPGAGKWYKANRHQARQDLQFNVGAAASLEWLPQENIVFDGADVHWQADITLAEGAVFAGWDIVCLGRQARQENWQTGGLAQRLSIKRAGHLQWLEQTKLTPAHPLMQSLIGLDGCKVMGTFVVVAGQVPEDLLAKCREVISMETEAIIGVSALPEVFVARYVGNVSQAAKQYFEAIWQQLRPWYLNRPAVRPRIWNT